MKNFARELGVEMGNSLLHLSVITFGVVMVVFSNDAFTTAFNGVLL